METTPSETPATVPDPEIPQETPEIPSAPEPPKVDVESKPTEAPAAASEAKEVERAAEPIGSAGANGESNAVPSGELLVSMQL